MKKISARWRNLYTKAGFSSFMASLLAILCGLVVGFVVLLVADPANAFWGLLAILTGGLSDSLSSTAKSPTPGRSASPAGPLGGCKNRHARCPRT